MGFQTHRGFARWRFATLALAVAVSLPGVPAMAGGGPALVKDEETSGRITFWKNVVGPIRNTGCCGSHLYSIHPDGSGETQLSPTGYYAVTPAWSPDGTKVAFAAFPSRSADIYVMDLEGPAAGIPRRVVSTDRYSELYPTWSPDGRQLAYVRWWVDRSAPSSYLARMESSIWSVRVDGTEQRRITRGPSPHEQTPSWSPTGPWIAFARRDYDEPRGLWHIYVVRSDGKKIRRLTHGNMYSWGPAWSPDGTQIAFTGSVARGDAASLNASGVFIVPARGGEPKYVAQASTHETVCWSPDGTRVAYGASSGDVSTRVAPNQQLAGDLYSVKTDGSDLRQITFTPHTAERDCDWTAR